MSTLMERDSKGNVKINDGGKGVNLQVPEDMSMLAVLGGRNTIFDGAHYKNDGWIYFKDKPVKKWFMHRDGFRLWEPTLWDLPKLESRYWNIKRICEKFYLERWRPIYERLLEVGNTHAKPTHKFNSSVDWWFYKVRIEGDKCWISWDWVEAPKEPLNQEVGQAYYYVDQWMEKKWRAKGMFRQVLEESFLKYLGSEFKDVGPGKTMHLTVNGRHYWYVTQRTRWGGSEWVKMVWPEEESMMEIAL